MKFQIPNLKSQISSKLQIPIGCAEWLGVAVGRSVVAQIFNLLYRRIAFGRASAIGEALEFPVAIFNAETQRRRDAEEEGESESRWVGSAPQNLFPLCASAPLRLCAKIPSATTPDAAPDSERWFPNRRGAERSTGFSPLHRADDEGFRKNSCAGKRRGVKRPEGRVPGAQRAAVLNPNGIPSLSPGLRGTSYPGCAMKTGTTLKGLRHFSF